MRNGEKNEWGIRTRRRPIGRDYAGAKDAEKENTRLPCIVRWVGEKDIK
jgi:hypothetical protein